MANRKFSFETINGIPSLRVKNHPIMSTGVWNDWFYSEEDLEDAFNKTDWTDANNLNLFFDHEDTKAKNWVGKVENPHYNKGTIYGDVIVVNTDAQNALKMGTKFGISPKILGSGNDSTKTVKNFTFKNWSLVVDPACKTTFLNSEKKVDDGIYLLPMTTFILNKKTGDVMENENIDNTHKPETPANETFTRDDIKNIVSEALKDNTPKVQETKTTEPEVTVVKNSDREAKFDKMIHKMAELGIANPEYIEFARVFKNENRDATLKDVARAWNHQLTEKRVTQLVEQKLSAAEKGQKVSQKADVPSTSAKVNDSGYDDVDVGMLNYLNTGFNRSMPVSLVLQMQPTRGPLGFRVFELASTAITASVVPGTVFGAATYPLEPIMFMRAAIDAAKENLMFQQAVRQYTLPEGNKDMVVPYRTTYFADASWEASTAEPAAGAEIAWTAVNTPDGVKITPTHYNYGVALSNNVLGINALNLIQYMREELSYKYENSTDSAVRNAIFGTVTTGGTSTAPTEMSNSVRGAQTIFGGDATDASSSLDAGDILTTKMFAKARRLLMSTRGFYWTGNVHTISAIAKNPWSPTASEPFICYIAPEQEEAFLNETQFTNAAEYGSNEVVLNGEIGKYLGTKIVNTTKVPGFVNADEIKVQGAQSTQDVTGHLCGLVKAGVCGATVWGLKPDIKVFDYPSADQVRMKLSMRHATSAVFGDAIVRMAVSDA